MAMKLLVIFLGAGLGGVLRYVVGWAVQGAWTPGQGVPWGTVAVNVSGCVAIGVLGGGLWGGGGPGGLLGGAREEWRLAVLVGVLGGYTTFSSFGRETVALMSAGRWGAAAVNVAVSNVAGLAGVYVGAVLAGRTAS